MRNGSARPTQRFVLCAGDEWPQAVQETLGEFKVVVVKSGFEALSSLKHGVFDAYILDEWLPEWSSRHLCREIRKSDPYAPVLFYASPERDRDRARVLRAGVSQYLTKPVDAEHLSSKLRVFSALADAESLNANAHAHQALREAFDEIAQKLAALGRTGQISRTLLERAARSRVYVVFTDNRGTRANFERWWPQAFASALEGREDLCRPSG